MQKKSLQSPKDRDLHADAELAAGGLEGVAEALELGVQEIALLAQRRDRVLAPRHRILQLHPQAPHFRAEPFRLAAVFLRFALSKEGFVSRSAGCGEGKLRTWNGAVSWKETRFRGMARGRCAAVS